MLTSPKTDPHRTRPSNSSTLPHSTSGELRVVRRPPRVARLALIRPSAGITSHHLRPNAGTCKYSASLRKATTRWCTHRSA
eukprot:scaffold259266_cov30-Tisochrysis_lutea.AAC.1